MIVKLVAYETEFDEEQDNAKVEMTLYDPEHGDLLSDFNDFLEALGIEEET